MCAALFLSREASGCVRRDRVLSASFRAEVLPGLIRDGFNACWKEINGEDVFPKWFFSFSAVPLSESPGIDAQY